MSNSLQPHESQHTRPPCPSPTPGIYSNSCPLSWWCHPAISSSIIPFPSCPQSFPASGSFPTSQLFAWGGQSIGVSASASVLPTTPRTYLLQDGLVGSPCSPRDSQEESPNTKKTEQFRMCVNLVTGFQSHTPKPDRTKGRTREIQSLRDFSALASLLVERLMKNKSVRK